MQAKAPALILLSWLALSASPWSDSAAAQGAPQFVGVPQVVAVPQEPPLPGPSTLTNLVVTKGRFEQWTVDFDYYFNGESPVAVITIQVTPQHGLPASDNLPWTYESTRDLAQRGAHHYSTDIVYPGRAERTIRVTASLRGGVRSDPGKTQTLVSQGIDQAIDWPDPATSMRNKLLATHSAEEVLKQAVELIDSENEPQEFEARTLLEALIASNPRLEAAYIELARIAMKTNWGPAGLRQAEQLLGTALRINPQSVNAKILLGYVYTHQKHYDKAEALYVESARADPPNLWLWSNWGEMLELEGKPDQAIEKYRHAIDHAATHDTNDRARLFAMQKQVGLLKARSDLAGMEAIYKQRVDEFGPGNCYSAEYSSFLLNVRGNAQAAIDLATRALNLACDDTASRQILGLANYLKWATTDGPVGEEALSQAHLYLPAGPSAFLGLAASDLTLPAARKLIATGEQVDEPDNDRMTALAYALQSNDIAAARRLLKLGARIHIQVGELRMPLAMLPVIEGHTEAIQLLRDNGVDYAKVRFQGVSAYDIASRMENPAVLRAMGNKQARL